MTGSGHGGVLHRRLMSPQFGSKAYKILGATRFAPGWGLLYGLSPWMSGWLSQGMQIDANKHSSKNVSCIAFADGSQATEVNHAE